MTSLQALHLPLATCILTNLTSSTVCFQANPLTPKCRGHLWMVPPRPRFVAGVKEDGEGKRAWGTPMKPLRKGGREKWFTSRQ